MSFTQEQLQELKVLSLFAEPSSLNGIKVHHTADPAVIEATQRLFSKGLVDHVDGGYLTDLGREALDQLQSLQGLIA